VATAWIHRIGAGVMILIAVAHLVHITWSLGVWPADAAFVLLGFLNLVAAGARTAARLRSFCRIANVVAALVAVLGLVLGPLELLGLLFAAAILGQAVAGLSVLARPA
jgi:hypothetical protein